MAKYEFHVPSMRKWPRLWWHNYRWLVRQYLIGNEKALYDSMNSLRRDIPWETTN